LVDGDSCVMGANFQLNCVEDLIGGHGRQPCILMELVVAGRAKVHEPLHHRPSHSGYRWI
jgi:hypothetical protein